MRTRTQSEVNKINLKLYFSSSMLMFLDISLHSGQSPNQHSGWGWGWEGRERSGKREGSASLPSPPSFFPSSLSFNPFDASYEGYIIAANVARSCPINTQIPLSFSSSVSGAFAPLLCRSKNQLIFVTPGQLCAFTRSNLRLGSAFEVF